MIEPMLRYFETLLPGAVPPPQQARRSGPPTGLLAFYWHFIRQAKPVFVAMFATSLGIALLDTLLPVLIGRLVTLVEAPDRQAALADRGRCWSLSASPSSSAARW